MSTFHGYASIEHTQVTEKTLKEFKKIIYDIEMSLNLTQCPFFSIFGTNLILLKTENSKTTKKKEWKVWNNDGEGDFFGDLWEKVHKFLQIQSQNMKMSFVLSFSSFCSIFVSVSSVLRTINFYLKGFKTEKKEKFFYNNKILFFSTFSTHQFFFNFLFNSMWN